MMTEVRVPTLGESVTEATVATWFKKPGDAVAVDEMLCELETDKVTVEVPAPIAGTLTEIVAAEGDTVGVDALLAQISEGGAAKKNDTDDTPKPEEKVPSSSDTGPGDIRPRDDEKPAETPKSSGTEMDIMVPTLGESVTEATVSTWFKKPGEAFEADEMLCELETDKVSVEVPAPAAGVLTKLHAEEGATVEARGTLAVISPDGTPAVSAPSAPAATAAPATASKDIEDAPSAKKMMAENNLTDVKGTGKEGRVMKEDVLKALASPAPAVVQAAPPRAPVAADQESREERVKMTRLRQTIARRLKESQNTAAMLTTYNEVDMTEVMALRNEYNDLFLKIHGVKLG
ncbi:MAG: E3 binding domain-containing protein, partial [Octadecabacter sp.]